MKPPRRPPWVEVSSIVFSVLFALMVNALWQDRAAKKEADFASKRIGKELQLNRKALDESREYYRSMAKTLEPWVRDPSTPPPERVPGWKGVRPPILRDASYTVALSTDTLSHLDFKLAEEITHVYALQEMFDLLLNKYLDSLLARSATSTTQDFRFLLTMFSDLASLADAVIRAYDDLIPQIAPGPPSPEDLEL